MAKNQCPVGQHVDQIRRDQHDHDGPNQSHALQVAPQRRVEHQRADAPNERLHVGDGLFLDRAVNAPHPQERDIQPRKAHQHRRQHQADVDGL